MCPEKQFLERVKQNIPNQLMKNDKSPFETAPATRTAIYDDLDLFEEPGCLESLENKLLVDFEKPWALMISYLVSFLPSNLINASCC